MATAKNPITKRVQTHKFQAKSMLTPGLSASVRTDQGSRLSNIFSRFSVGKAKKASSKMRFLDHRRMGNIQSDTKSFSETISQKFHQPQSFLHINPIISRDTTIWNEIEKTLPAQATSSYEEPAQSDELRAGSVIQKFSMMPEQGQSIESFKKQVASRPKPQAKHSTASPKPTVSPKSRLFSRVQEVTPSQPKANETGHLPEEPATAQPSTIQQQQEPVTEPPKQTSITPPPLVPQEKPEQSNEDILKMLTGVMDEKTEEQGVEDKPAEKPTSVAKRKPLAKKTPRTDSTSPKALPVAKTNTPTVQRKLDIPTPKPKAPKPAKKLQEIKKEKSTVVEPAGEKKESTVSQDTVPETPPAIEIPLRKKIQERQETPKAVKSLKLKVIKPIDPKPLFTPPERPLVSRQKYTRKETPDAEPIQEPVVQKAPVPEKRTHRQERKKELPVGFSDMDNLLNERSSEKVITQKQPTIQKSTTPTFAPVQDGRQRLSMELAKSVSAMPVPAQPREEKSTLPPELLTPPVLLESQQKEKLERPPIQERSPLPMQQITKQTSAPSTNIVQRQSDEDTSAPINEKEIAPNLDQLAEDVLPYVKRILEIETERIPGDLR